MLREESEQCTTGRVRKDSRLTSLSSLRPVDRSKSTPMTDQPSTLCGLFCRTKGPHYSGKLSLSCPKVVLKSTLITAQLFSSNTMSTLLKEWAPHGTYPYHCWQLRQMIQLVRASLVQELSVKVCCQPLSTILMQLKDFNFHCLLSCNYYMYNTNKKVLATLHVGL